MPPLRTAARTQQPGSHRLGEVYIITVSEPRISTTSVGRPTAVPLVGGLFMFIPWLVPALFAGPGSESPRLLVVLVVLVGAAGHWASAAAVALAEMAPVFPVDAVLRNCDAGTPCPPSRFVRAYASVSRQHNTEVADP